MTMALVEGGTRRMACCRANRPDRLVFFGPRTLFANQHGHFPLRLYCPKKSLGLVMVAGGILLLAGLVKLVPA